MGADERSVANLASPSCFEEGLHLDLERLYVCHREVVDGESRSLGRC